MLSETKDAADLQMHCPVFLKLCPYSKGKTAPELFVLKSTSSGKVTVTSSKTRFKGLKVGSADMTWIFSRVRD